MNPFITEMMVKEKHNEMLAEAERMRLIAGYERNRQSKKAKLLAALGEKLILLGEKLHRRYGHELRLPSCKAG